MATQEQIEQMLVEQQRQMTSVTNQLTGLTSAVYTQSVAQIVKNFDGEPKQYKDWIKAIEKYRTLTRLGDGDIPRVAYQSCTGPVGDFIRRYLAEKEEAREDPSLVELKPSLTRRFAEINDQHQAFAILRKTKQKHNESVQLYSERLLNLAEDAYPQAGARPVVEQQMMNVFLTGCILTI
ncbi:Hypothetical predicted protein [Mytilus galloprovincialis]|uniref:Retrotransposon gag domain-containing protein n=1 Tax=Mytilus galloprovincialis TaxID=29158 RepID=A0A8B6EPZ8_MYTGA|nr:Hypothetical predicted protein [Mytilus galloprovincialis]